MDTENVDALCSLLGDIEHLHANREQVDELTGVFDKQIRVLESFPVVAPDGEQVFERDSIRGKLDIDPDQGASMLRQVRAMFDSLARTYERRATHLQAAFDSRMEGATADEIRAFSSKDRT